MDNSTNNTTVDVMAWAQDKLSIEATEGYNITVNFLLVSGEYITKLPAVPPIQRKLDTKVIASYFGWPFFPGHTLIQQKVTIPLLAAVCGAGGTGEMASALLEAIPTVGPEFFVSVHPAHRGYTVLDLAAGTGNTEVVKVLLMALRAKGYNDSSLDPEKFALVSSALSMAAHFYSLEIVELIFNSFPSLSYSSAAVNAIKTACAQESPNKKGFSALDLAKLILEFDTKSGAFHLFALKEMTESESISFPKEIFGAILSLVHSQHVHPFLTQSDVFMSAVSADLELVRFFLSQPKLSSHALLSGLLLVFSQHRSDALEIILEFNKFPINGHLSPEDFSGFSGPLRLAPDSTPLHYAYAYCDPTDLRPGMKIVNILKAHGAVPLKNSDGKLPEDVLGAFSVAPVSCTFL